MIELLIQMEKHDRGTIFARGGDRDLSKRRVNLIAAGM